MFIVVIIFLINILLFSKRFRNGFDTKNKFNLKTNVIKSMLVEFYLDSYIVLMFALTFALNYKKNF